MDRREAEQRATSEYSFRIMCEATAEDQTVSKDGQQDSAAQQRRLARYFIAASIANFVCLSAVSSLHWSTPDLSQPHVLVLATIATVSCAMTIIPSQVSGRLNVGARCVAAYVSTALLMLAPISLLLLLDKAYAVIMIPLFPVCVSILLPLRKGAQIGFASGAVQYVNHENDLRCLFHLAAGITVPAYAGLLGHLVHQFNRISHRQERMGVHVVECLLLYSVVAGLVLMLLTSSPPALYLRQTRAVIVNKFLGALADVQLGLVALAGFAATVEKARGYAVLSFSTITISACAVFRREHEDEPDHRGEHDIKPHLSSVSAPGMTDIIVYSLAFGMLMVSYSTFSREHVPLSGCSTMAWAVVASSLLVGSLCQIALQRRAPRTECMVYSIAMFRAVHNALLAIVVAFSVIMLAYEQSKAIVRMKDFLFNLVQ